MPNIINFSDSEIIIALIGAVGTDLKKVIDPIKNRLNIFNYDVEEIRISTDVIQPLFPEIKQPKNNGDKINSYMDLGNRARKLANDKAVLASGAASIIYNNRLSEHSESKPLNRKAFIINSLKTPDELHRLKEIYQSGFYSISVHEIEARRIENLKHKSIKEDAAKSLVRRDEDESDEFGQHTRDIFHLSDFFVQYDGNDDVLQNSIVRIIDIIFGHPYITPTFDEFAMFMAFSSALRSADLSRQVGAVIAKNQSIISTGANDVPKANGGLYWPKVNNFGVVEDHEAGRDFKRGFDSNSLEKKEIVSAIMDSVREVIKNKDQQAALELILKKSKIKDITEYGRVVHAEMDAILACTRNGNSTIGTTLYCTTFPCHNCAKHVIASGINRVVYIEPYPKSKALEFHDDSISQDKANTDKVIFEPFVGVGPRKFFDLFSMNLGDGFPVTRKQSNGEILDWQPSDNLPIRIQMHPLSYIEKETIAAEHFKGTITSFTQGEGK